MPRDTDSKERTRLADARKSFVDDVEPVERTENVPVVDADGRVLAGAVAPERPVPAYDHATTDGFAVVAEATFGASDRSPNVLETADDSEGVDERTAVRVQPRDPLPSGATAVIPLADTAVFGDELELYASATEGEHVARVGDEVPADAALFGDGRRLRPSHLGVLRSAGVGAVEVYERPTVEVIPAGDRRLGSDAIDDSEGDVGADADGSAAGANANAGMASSALTVSRYVENWAGNARTRNVVPAEDDAIRVAIERGLTADVLVTVGGFSAGQRCGVADVVAERGTCHVHRLAVDPGADAAFGVVEGTPILMLSRVPVSGIVNANSLLRPALKRASRLPEPAHPTTRATLARKVASEPGVRTFVGVKLEATAGTGTGEEGYRAVPERAPGAGGRSPVGETDGWVTIPESVEGLDAGETVAVEDWEYAP